MQLSYRNRPEISETYIDLLHVTFAEGAIIKMEFTVNRPNQPSSPDAAITGDSVTACRLTMPVQGAMDMAFKLNDLIAKLRNAGVIKQVAEAPTVIN